MNIYETLTIFLVALTGFQITAMQQPDLRQQLINAAFTGNNDRVEQLMFAGAPVAPEALFYATTRGNYEIVKTIFECGADPESPADPNQMIGSTSLFMYLVLAQEHQPQVKEKLIKLYLKHGADIGFRDLPGNTPRHWVLHLDFTLLKLLLEQGASVNAQDDSGNTALMILSFTLIHSHRGKTELGKMREQELKKKAELLIEHGADVNLKDNIGLTSLMNAVLSKNMIFVELLLNNGADINLKDNDGKTSLMYAVMSRNMIFIELLLKNGADINQRNKAGKTCLMEAVVREDKAIVEFLLEKNANTNLKNSSGKSALDYAKDQPEILKLLEDTQVSTIEKFIRQVIEYFSLGILTF